MTTVFIRGTVKQEWDVPVDGWLTVTEAAQFSGYSEYHIRYLLREGRLAGQKVGQSWLVKREDLERYKSEMDQLGTAKFDRTRSSQPDDP